MSSDNDSTGLKLRKFEDKPLYHSDELLELFGCTFETFRKKVGSREGQLQAAHAGGKGYIIRREALLLYLEYQEVVNNELSH